MTSRTSWTSSGSSADVRDHRHLHPRWHRISQRPQQLILVAPLVALQCRGQHRPPHQRRRPPVAGQHRQYDGFVAVTREARPVQRHHHLCACTDHVRDPVAEEPLDIDAVVAQQPVDLLDAVLAEPAHRLGQTLTDCMDGQRGAGEHAKRCVRKRQDSFRMKVAFVHLRDEFADVVSSQHGLLGHHLAPEWLAGAMVIPILPIGNAGRLRLRDRPEIGLRHREMPTSTGCGIVEKLNRQSYSENCVRILKQIMRGSLRAPGVLSEREGTASYRGSDAAYSPHALRDLHHPGAGFRIAVGWTLLRGTDCAATSFPERHPIRFTKQLTTFASERRHPDFVNPSRVRSHSQCTRGPRMARARPHRTCRDRNSDGRYDYACVRKPNTVTVAALLAAILIHPARPRPYIRIQVQCLSFTGPRPGPQDAAMSTRSASGTGCFMTGPDRLAAESTRRTGCHRDWDVWLPPGRQP